MRFFNHPLSSIEFSYLPHLKNRIPINCLLLITIAATGCSGANGVANGPDCLVKTSEKGEIRFVVKPSPLQLSADLAITELDIKLPCVNRYNTKDVRASGSWSVPDFDAADPLGLMTFNEEECFHSVVFSNLQPNTQYKWKVTIGNSWKENYGCSGCNFNFEFWNLL